MRLRYEHFADKAPVGGRATHAPQAVTVTQAINVATTPQANIKP